MRRGWLTRTVIRLCGYSIAVTVAHNINQPYLGLLAAIGIVALVRLLMGTVDSSNDNRVKRPRRHR